MSEQVVSMEVRLAMAAHAVLEDSSLSVSEVCRRFGISRDSYYRYRRRLRDEGLVGLVPLSRRPGMSPGATSPEMVAVLVAKHDQLVDEGWDGGARSVHDWLALEQVPGLPSARTIHKYLAAAGRTTPTPAKRPKKSFHRFEAMQPNGMWQLDGTQVALAGGAKAVVLRFQDDHSRMVLATRAAPSENGTDVWECMVTAMDRHGKPAVVLCDNGSAFTSRFTRGVGGFSEFETRLRLIGVAMVNSSPHHPQTCGKKEREWGTFKQWLATREPAADLGQLQRLAEAYDEIFNTRRPHQGIGGCTPQARYDAGTKAEPDPQQQLDRASIHHVRVTAGGYLDLPHVRLALGPSWAGADIDYLIDSDHVVLFTGTELIAHLDLNRTTFLGKPRCARDYIRIERDT
ncbi:DDE-type integrase/transposase/recombinase [Phycicoccus sonneratiae]|uniref:Transposase family protein n=1 Tax=Phycicoccus sonneratiae TaxID=2807628 RepID=A0ABS2CRV7_9MICO|nr:DDE-type integrase/transposase/recombinase [Phycicoccus sonneraticus]MBM6402627.1 transposase family protein [Phycicoccus sonneraticus]